MKNIVLTGSLLFLSFFSATAQESFEEYKARKAREYNSYKGVKDKELEDYRRKRNEEYAAHLRKLWKEAQNHPSVNKPKEKDVPPVVIDGEKTLPDTPRRIPIDKVVEPVSPKPQPSPIEPIKEMPHVDPVRPLVHQTCSFTFFGTKADVRFDRGKLFGLKDVRENSVADAWIALSCDEYNNLIHDCLEIRKRHNLCDWAYLQMLDKMSESVCGTGTNEATLLMAYVYCQSGYKMRLGYSGSRLYMLYASDHVIYGKPYFVVGGEQYYVFGSDQSNVNISGQEYPKEQPLSLTITRQQMFDNGEEQNVGRSSKKYTDIKTSTSVNANLLSFYDTYPSSMTGDDVMTRWAMYANTPMAEDVRSRLYPQLEAALEGCDTHTAVGKLLDYVQTGFEYEYDDKVWGDDRVFFPEETLHYPYCDCEDRSILFTRLVRDLVGLKCVLVYYPGHLASAVCMGTGDVSGDYITLNGENYIVCDPTYIGAAPGSTMPGMDNAQAQVILLR